MKAWLAHLCQFRTHLTAEHTCLREKRVGGECTHRTFNMILDKCPLKCDLQFR